MGGSGEVDDARAALRLLEVVAGDVIPPSRLGRRGDLAVAPSRRNLRASFVEARAWFALGLEVAGRTLPGTMRATVLEMNSRPSLVMVLRKDVREVLDVLKTGRLSKSVVVPEHGANGGTILWPARFR